MQYASGAFHVEKKSNGQICIWSQANGAWLVLPYNKAWPWQVQMAAPVLRVFRAKEEALSFMEEGDG